MIPILESDEYVKRMLSIPRPGAENILAFYEHRLGAICTDPRLLLLPLDDHLAHRGDGVFETLKYLDRRVYQLEPHLKRMKVSADAIFLTPPCSWDKIGELVLEVAKASGRDMGLIRILLGRGPGSFGIDPDECPVPSLYIVAYGFHPKPEEFFERGVSAFRTSTPAKQDYMARIKSVNYLPNVLMKREAVQK
ncbi:MAG: aminotransferase class IV, partial [Thermodesulfobacteriota bacterium]|nr:aminotransferase class IV [Thermodesulfobacteriota bacterium]